jgi:hypothetical protein
VLDYYAGVLLQACLRLQHVIESMPEHAAQLDDVTGLLEEATAGLRRILGEDASSPTPVLDLKPRLHRIPDSSP